MKVLKGVYSSIFQPKKRSLKLVHPAHEKSEKHPSQHEEEVEDTLLSIDLQQLVKWVEYINEQDVYKKSGLEFKIIHDRPSLLIEVRSKYENKVIQELFDFQVEQIYLNLKKHPSDDNSKGSLLNVVIR